MEKPVLYLHLDTCDWTALHQGWTLGVVAAREVKLEQALRSAQNAHPDYDVRVWAWAAPKRDSFD